MSSSSRSFPNRLSSSRLCAFTSSATTLDDDDDDPKREEVDGFSVFPRTPVERAGPFEGRFRKRRDVAAAHESNSWNTINTRVCGIGWRQSRKRSVDGCRLTRIFIEEARYCTTPCTTKGRDSITPSANDLLSEAVPPRYFSIKEQAEKVWQQQVADGNRATAKIGR